MTHLARSNRRSAMPRAAAGTSIIGPIAAAAFAACLATAAHAAAEGGLYVAGYGFSFDEVAARAIAQNPGGRRFFVLVLPEEAAALRGAAARPLAAARERVVAAGGVLMVCRRDLDEGRIDPRGLAPGVVAVRGWPSPDRPATQPGPRHLEGEDPRALPDSDTALRRLRSTCS